MRKAYKLIFSLSVVLIAGLNFIIPAFAQDPFTGIAIGGIGGASGAGLFGSMAGMSGIDINYTSDPVNDAMWNKLNPDSVYFDGEKHEATGQGEDVWDYITVDLEDWLQAQSDFIINFAQTNNVTDDSSGTVTGSYEYAGYPFNYNLSTDYYGEPIGYVGDQTIEYANYKLVLNRTQSNRYYYLTYINGQTDGIEIYQETYKQGQPVRLVYQSVAHNILAAIVTTYVSACGRSFNITLNPPSNTQWTSETVNTHVFDGWENAKVKIPHSISGLQPNWTIPEFMGAINTLWTNQQQGQIVIEDTDTPVPPPTPTPVPDTPLGDVPFDDWVDLWGQGIYEQLENQSDALDFIGSNGEDAVEELESIDSNLDDLNETAESIDTNIGTGIGLLGGIKSAVESAVDFLEGIAEHVEELVEEVVQATETLIAGILNQIPTVFGIIFGPIKQASSIWHYVVEWIQSISAPMSWMWSMASGTSYNIVLPVYASLAGAVVLAFYKRFGK